MKVTEMSREKEGIRTGLRNLLEAIEAEPKGRPSWPPNRYALAKLWERAIGTGEWDLVLEISQAFHHCFELGGLGSSPRKLRHVIDALNEAGQPLDLYGLAEGQEIRVAMEEFIRESSHKE